MHDHYVARCPRCTRKVGYPTNAKRARCACGYDVLRDTEWRTTGSIDPDDWTHDEPPGCGGCR